MLIGITGKAGAGKDTVGAILKDKLNMDTYAFARPLKNTINTLFSWDDRHAYGILKEEVVYTRVVHLSEIALILNTTFSNFVEEDSKLHMQMNFFEVFRPYLVFDNLGYAQWKISPRKAYQLFGTDFARKLIKDTIWLDMAPKQNVIITDVRFDNEANMVKDNGGILIQVLRNTKEIKENNHTSEMGVKDYLVDVIVDNDSTKKKLKEKIDKLLEVLNAKYSEDK